MFTATISEIQEEHQRKEKRLQAQANKQKITLEKLGFVQMMFDFYTTPLE